MDFIFLFVCLPENSEKCFFRTTYGSLHSKWAFLKLGKSETRPGPHRLFPLGAECQNHMLQDVNRAMVLTLPDKLFTYKGE